jgi:hypothetical protein
MEGKLRQLMKHEGVNSTRLAEILGIQASGISHIMSGRNKPSFDFLLKLLQRFPQINPDWLLLDKGPMYRDEIKNRNSGGAGGSVQNNASHRIGIQVDSNNTTSDNRLPPNQMADKLLLNELPHSDGGNAYHGGATGHSGKTGELFGPDNTDIIPSDNLSVDLSGGLSGGPEGHFGGKSTGYGSQSDGSGGKIIGAMDGRSPQHVPQQTPQNARQQLQQPSQPPLYQSTGFTKSAMIERIVVFYKDKTFSEYQPG